MTSMPEGASIAHPILDTDKQTIGTKISNGSRKDRCVTVQQFSKRWPLCEANKKEYI